MLELAHSKYGSKPWSDLIQPAITLSEAGFPISPRMATSIEGIRERLQVQPAAAAYFLNPDGSTETAGTNLQNPALAQTFKTIATGGANAFYTSALAQKIVAADRGVYMADSDFVSVPLDGLLNDAYLTGRSALIDPATAMAAPVAGIPPGVIQAMGQDTSLQLPSTSHVSIVDSDGNVVSVTTTIEGGFGSLQFVEGILLNNQRTDFLFQPNDAAGRPIANRVQPGKRPRSSMSPTIVLNDQSGEVKMAIGSPGGSAIIQYVAKTIIGAIDWQLDIQQAINLPNVGAGNSSNVRLEAGSVNVADIKTGLEAKGHTVDAPRAATSGLQGFAFNGTRADGSPGLLARDPGLGT